VQQLGAFLILIARNRGFRLECHAALGAGTLMILTHFGVHRASINRFARRWCAGLCVALHRGIRGSR